MLNGLFTISPLRYFDEDVFSLFKHEYNYNTFLYTHTYWSFHHPFGYGNYEMCISEDLYLSDCNYPPSKPIQINNESTQLGITRESLMWNHSYEDSFPFSHTLLTIVTSCSK